MKHTVPIGKAGTARPTRGSMQCALFGAALRADGVALSDFSALRLPARIERIQPRLLPEEFRLLEDTVLRRLTAGGYSRFLIARDLALLSLLADTGLRAAECCALNVEDVDLDKGVVTVHRGKGSKVRLLSILDDDPAERDGGQTVGFLRDYLTWRDSNLRTGPASVLAEPPGQAAHNLKSSHGARRAVR